MAKVLIFGNSGSGKSTLAKKMSSSDMLAHLDLDTLAWLATPTPTRRALNDSQADILNFIEANNDWVIEGCYSDLLEIALPFSSEIIFMNLAVELCIANARKRPWEPHKYVSKQAQDQNLEMLIDWISQYSLRTDTFSATAHNKIYVNYAGQKRMVTSNE